MNDPVPTADPTPALDPAPPEPPAATEGDFGATLRAAREAAGISVPALAGRLRLHVRQIEALERSDLAALPTIIYVRGFVRSCARELKIDVAPLLADLDRRAGVVAGAPLVSSAGSFQMSRLGDGSRSIVVIALVALVVAGIIGTLWPRRANVPSRAAIAETPVPAPSPPEPGPALAPGTDAGPEAGAAGMQAVPAATPPAQPLPAVATTPGTASGAGSRTMPAAPPVSAAGGAQGAAPGKAPATALANAAAMAAPGKAPPARAADASAPAANRLPAPVSAPAPVAAAPAPQAVVPATPAADDGATLVLHVHASSWVEVVQANGTSVFSQICPAGSVQTLHAEPPLRVVVGNAAAVDAQFRGNAIDLNRYANANGVARFTLQ